MTTMRELSQRAIAFATSLSLSAAALPPVAHAQFFSDDVVARCAQIVGQMRFEGMPAERNHSMMMLSCQAKGGSIPGSFEGRAASLPRAGKTR